MYVQLVRRGGVSRYDDRRPTDAQARNLYPRPSDRRSHMLRRLAKDMFSSGVSGVLEEESAAVPEPTLIVTMGRLRGEANVSALRTGLRTTLSNVSLPVSS